MPYLYVINSTKSPINQLHKIVEKLDAKLLALETKNTRYCSQIGLLQLETQVFQANQGYLDEFELDYIFSTSLLKVPKLVVFDMDSTLIPIEVIDELAAFANKKEQVSEITELAMQGHLDFDQSLQQRVACLENLDESVIKQLSASLEFNPGVQILCDYLISENSKVAIASGGFLPFAKALQKKVPFDFVSANQLEIIDNQLTGRVVGNIVNAKEKARLLMTWSQELSIDLAETMAVGDGANDLLMLESAGLGIAYHAKDKVNRQANSVLKHSSMAALIDVFEFAQINAK